jgi:hypothetical protein
MSHIRGIEDVRSKECENSIVWFLHCEVEAMPSVSLLLHAIGESSLKVSILMNGNMQEICVVECMHSIHEVVADDIPPCPMHKAIKKVRKSCLQSLRKVLSSVSTNRFTQALITSHVSME